MSFGDWIKECKKVNEDEKFKVRSCISPKVNVTFVKYKTAYDSSGNKIRVKYTQTEQVDADRVTMSNGEPYTYYNNIYKKHF